MKKKLSQIFLIKHKVAENIVNSMNLKKGEWVIEVGPGRGFLTKKLLAENVKVLAIEIDRKLYQYLKENVVDLDFFLEPADVLKVNFRELLRKYNIDKIKLVSNLPYHVTSPFIEKIIEERSLFSEIYLTLQKEVVDRIAAKPGNKIYGSLTIFVNYFMDVKVLFTVPRFFFRPVPGVSSVFIKLKPKGKPPFELKDEKLFFEITRKTFSKRRKQLINVLKEFLDREKLIELENFYNLKERGENLSAEDFAFISNFIYKKRNEKR